MQTIPFYYHIIVLIIEIILLILTLVFGMKNMQNYFQNRIRNLNNIEIIRFSENVLKSYNIDVNGEFMEILIELLNKAEEAEFLFAKNSLSTIQNIDKSKDKENIITDIENCILPFSKFMNSINK